MRLIRDTTSRRLPHSELFLFRRRSYLICHQLILYLYEPFEETVQ